MANLRFKMHAIIQMDERGLSVDDVRMAPDNGEDIETRPDDHPYLLDWCSACADWVPSTSPFVTTSRTTRSSSRRPIAPTRCWGAGPQDPQEEPMKCIVCHNGETKPGTTTLTFHREGQTVVVNEVPAEVCENCGEAYVAEDVTTQVLNIAARAREAHAQVLVRDFAPAA